MLTTQVLILWLAVALVGAGAWQLLGKRLFSGPARDFRRRRRNYGRVASRRRGPTVRLAVRVARP
ncbi:MAG TPA: hypothetical protein VN829_08420 [Dongiaceae bacterium]|nr:hypothetical protein [Dongiaceae bacterium]